MILALGMLVRLLSGNTHIYKMLLLPRCALGIGAYIVIGTVFYFLMGIAIELIWSHVPCFSGERYMYITMCVLAVLLSYLRHFFFFGINAFFFSFVAAVLSCALLVTAFLRLMRHCLPCGIILLIFAVWNAYMGFVNFCVFLLN
jgi:tryptophan-rich sensory protein